MAVSRLTSLLEFVGELQANNSQLHMSNTRLQATQKIGQAKEQQLQGKMTIHRPWVPGLTRSEAHIALLREELALVKGMNNRRLNSIGPTDIM